MRVTAAASVTSSVVHALRGCAVDADGPIAGLPKCREQRTADAACGAGDESGGTRIVHWG